MMAQGQLSIEESQRMVLLCAMQSLEENAESVKFEINIQVDKLIETVNQQREHYLKKIDIELVKAKEPLKMHENRILAQLENAKKFLARELEGNEMLVRKLSESIDKEIKAINIELPIFKFQWKANFIRLCERFEEIGELYIYMNSRFENVSSLLWNSPLYCGKGDNELTEAKALALDPETCNIYLGDSSLPKILVLDKLGEYLGTLKIKKPSSIGRMVICQNSIYCKVNNYLASTVYRLDKSTGEQLGKFECGNIASITAQPDQIFLCDYSLKINILSPDLAIYNEIPLESPFLKRGILLSSVISDMKCVKDELVMLVYNSKGNPIQVFNKTGTLLRAISEDIPITGFMEAYICIDEEWNIILSHDGSKLVNVYSKEGKCVAGVSLVGSGREEVYHPRGIALDRDGNLIVCNNRHKNILQAY